MHDRAKYGGRVVLVKKNRPAWQVGKLNGIGGHVEYNENFLGCMVREFHEEAGVEEWEWRHFLTITTPIYRIAFFESPTLYKHFDNIKSNTDEEIGVYDLYQLSRHDVIPNLTWSLPLAVYNSDEYDVIEVRAAKETA